MANTIYDSARVAFSLAEINWVNDNIKVVLLNTTYTPYPTTDSTYNDITNYTLLATANPISLTNKVTSTGNLVGALNADPATFAAPAALQTVGFVAFFKDYNPTNINGAPITNSTYTTQLAANLACPLIAMYDSGYNIGTGTNGFDITLTWDSVNGILRL